MVNKGCLLKIYIQEVQQLLPLLSAVNECVLRKIAKYYKNNLTIFQNITLTSTIIFKNIKSKILSIITVLSTLINELRKNNGSFYTAHKAL